MQELLPLWTSAPVKDGGLDFSSVEIGHVTMWMGALLIVYNAFLLPRLIKCFGAVRLFRYASLLWPVIMGVTPFVRYFIDHRSAAWDGHCCVCVCVYVCVCELQ